MIKRNKIYYLASPYSDNSNSVMRKRYVEQGRLAVILIHKGYKLITPIEMCHNLSKRYKLPSGYFYWKYRDRTLLQHCDGIIVCLMKGWDTSVGVTDELKYAQRLGIEIKFFNPITERFVNYKKAIKGTIYEPKKD